MLLGAGRMKRIRFAASGLALLVLVSCSSSPAPKAGGSSSSTAESSPSTVIATSSTATTSAEPDTPAPPPSPTPTATPAVALGQPQSNGIGQVVLFGVQYPYPAKGEAVSLKTPGTDFAVADIKVCPASSEVDIDAFTLAASDSTTFTFWNVQIGARSPDIATSLLRASAQTCVRGYLTFEVTHGEKLASFVVVDESGTAITWSL